MKLDHFTIRTPALEATKDFFCTALELTIGERPPFPFPGYWLYEGDIPIVHLIGDETFVPSEKPDTIDHLAFTGDGARYDELTSKFEAAGMISRTQIVPGMGLRQVFLSGPHGIRIELNFPAAD